MLLPSWVVGVCAPELLPWFPVVELVVVLEFVMELEFVLEDWIVSEPVCVLELSSTPPRSLAQPTNAAAAKAIIKYFIIASPCLVL